jgi:hypothetical protein
MTKRAENTAVLMKPMITTSSVLLIVLFVSNIAVLQRNEKRWWLVRVGQRLPYIGEETVKDE